MLKRSIRSFVATSVAICICTLAEYAQAYDKELHSLAAKLILQLESAGQKSGTVLDFTDLQGSPNELGRFLSQELSNELVASAKQMSFVDRANLQVLLRENKLSVEGLVNPESSRRLGNLIGIDTVVFGTTTPMGDKIRLSVRAVAVETGRIVATQSTTLPAGGLAELHTRGVSSDRSAAASTPADPRDRFRRDSIRLTAKTIIVSPRPAVAYSTDVTFVLENLSGMAFEAAIDRGSMTLGTCTFTDYVKGAGLDIVYGQRGKWRHIPVGGKITFTLSGFSSCGGLLSVKSADFAASLLIKADNQQFSYPISAERIPVQVGQTR